MCFAYWRRPLAHMLTTPTVRIQMSLWCLSILVIVCAFCTPPDFPCLRSLPPQVLQEAVQAFEGTQEGVRVMVADCEAAIAAGDLGGALARLERVPQSSPHYARACVAMAEIHLKHRGDKAACIKCYLHLVVSRQTLKSAHLAGHCIQHGRAVPDEPQAVHCASLLLTIVRKCDCPVLHKTLVFGPLWAQSYKHSAAYS